MSKRNQIAVVTGASTGIGQATARLLAARGFAVLAGIRRDEDREELAAVGVEPVVLDVTDPAQVDAIAERINGDPVGRPLGALVNNAGIAVVAPVEAIPMGEWRRQFDVNFFGHVSVIQALLPALVRAQGRIINVSSIAGRVAGPGFGAYSGSKFALEAMSDALRREVARLGVAVIVVEPGAVDTAIWGKALGTADGLLAGMSARQQALYGGLMAAVREEAQAMAARGITPEAAARVIVGAIEADNPRPRYLIGRDAKIKGAVSKWLPDRTLDRLIARSLGSGKETRTAVASTFAEVGGSS
jgi:NAD(P)-dependent dehydrogenase (short-subunit alcohol dehydrogenase family)